MHVDIGTGDGAFVLRTARANTDALVIGIDANADAMREKSHRASVKAARGGAPNALYVHASVENLPSELEGLASRVTILFPWGSLLRAVWSPDPTMLAGIARICRSNARVEIAVSISPRDGSAFAGMDLEPTARILDGWRAAGFAPTVVDPAAYETTWSRKLAFEPSRRFFAIESVLEKR